jgi:hypothetical protein
VTRIRWWWITRDRAVTRGRRRRRYQVGVDVAVEMCSDRPASPETLAALEDIARAAVAMDRRAGHTPD